MLIRKPSEIVSKKTISAIIYGQSGAGKTALACSAPSPVLFDFDNGVGRLDFGLECDTVQLTTLQQAFEGLQEVAAAGCYKTVIVDTLSKLVDKATAKKCGASMPQMRDWQFIYADCKRFVAAATELGLNIIFVAQDKEVKKSGKDDLFHRPDCPEKIYSMLRADVDIIGYLYYSTDGGVDKRTITFNPTTYTEGKNTAAFDAEYHIPTADREHPLTFMADRIAEFVKHQEAKDEARREELKAVERVLADFLDRLEAVDDAMSLNELTKWVLGQAPVGDSRMTMSRSIADKAKGLKLKFNKETKLYE